MKLLAKDAHDLAVLAAITQDALMPVGEMVFAAAEQKFYAVLNRFCWEEQTAPWQRIHSGLYVEQVKQVQLRNIDLKQPGQVLDLLTIFYEDGWLHLNFAGHRDLRLQVDNLACWLHDFGEGWAVKTKPCHIVEEREGERQAR